MTHIFSKEKLENTLGSWVAKHGLKQLRIAETEKYAHVTFFLNGGKELAEDNEDRQMFNSPKVLSYDTVPEMSAEPITNKILEAMDLNYSLIVANYANPDMVGHTGNLKAAIKACETVDLELNKILKKVTSKEATLLIIADHGNCEEMTNLKTGNPHTSHTLNLVPICLFGAGNSVEIQDGRLADVAPTILELIQLKKPLEMTGKSLISGFIGKP
jgi:2,3-bisphosphoglycerate-independent phosphoglycerate mutase